MKIILLISIAIGITLVYDSRKIVKQYFSKQDQNTTVFIFKVIGFFICVISGIALINIM